MDIQLSKFVREPMIGSKSLEPYCIAAMEAAKEIYLKYLDYIEKKGDIKTKYDFYALATPSIQRTIDEAIQYGKMDRE